MTELQVIVHGRLAERSPAIAGIYAAGLLLIALGEFPARGYFIAHAAREICNALPEIYGAAGDPELKIGPIASAWRTRVSREISRLAEAPDQPISVPRELVNHVEFMVSNELNLDGRKRRQFNDMCDVINPSALPGFTDPTIAEAWIRAKPVRFAHVQRDAYREPRDPGDAIESFNEVEKVLVALFKPADQAIPELEDLLREANEG